MGEEAAVSPKNRLKFLCSFGGKILPRPPDGHLRYVGGETRVVAIARTISFSDMKKKITNVCAAASDVVIKYQMTSEDLDALISVTCDEDLLHMVEEYDLFGSNWSSTSSSSPTSTRGGAPRLRVFLFPTATDQYNGQYQHQAIPLEQQYIEAINGVQVPFSPTAVGGRCRTMFTLSSAASSPTSTVDSTANLDFAALVSNRIQGMHKANSSPNLNLAGQRQKAHHHSRMYGLHHHDHHQNPPVNGRGSRRCGGWGVVRSAAAEE